MICSHLKLQPKIAYDAFIAPGATVLGDVTIGPKSSIWYQCVLRADIEKIVIGEGSNIQDGSIIHMASDRGTVVGDFVTVGHKALLHASTIGAETLVGMGAIVMDGAEIGNQSIVGAGSLIPRGKVFPDGSLIVGSPAKLVKKLDREERLEIRKWALKYIEVAREHADALEG